MATRWGRLEVSDILVLEPQRLVQPHGPGYPRGGSETHGRPPNQGGRGIFYFEDHGGIGRDITKTLWYILVSPESVAPAYLSNASGGQWGGDVEGSAKER